jgi:hypothetical protein
MNKMEQHACKNPPDSFCYVCGRYIPESKNRRGITETVKDAYDRYFHPLELNDQDKPWAPHSICSCCYANLLAWYNGKNRHMPFGVPMMWLEPENHVDDCYFCMITTVGFNAATVGQIKYPDIRSAKRPLPHSELIPIPPSPFGSPSKATATSAPGALDRSQESEYIPDDSDEPQLLSEAELHNLARMLKLSIRKSESLGSFLQQRNLLEKDVNITSFRKRSRPFAEFFVQKDQLCYCDDIEGLFYSFGLEHDPKDWRLFIDSSKTSLKAVLLHIGNSYPSIPVAHSAQMHETYENMKILLKAINYQQYEWNICGDLKVIGMLVGMQSGFVKHMCFLCLWDTRYNTGNIAAQYEKKEWTLRQSLIPGKFNVKNDPLVPSSHIFLPALHIKPGLMKQFVKALATDPDCPAFQHLRRAFPRLSDAKLK